MKKAILILLALALLPAAVGCVTAAPEAALPEATSMATAEPTPASTPEPTAEPTPEPTPEPAPTLAPAAAITIPAELDPDGLALLLNDLTVAMVEESGKYALSPDNGYGKISYYQSTRLLNMDGMVLVTFDKAGAPLGVSYYVFDVPAADRALDQVNYYLSIRNKLSDAVGDPYYTGLTDLETQEETHPYTTQNLYDAIAGNREVDCYDIWAKKAGVNIITELIVAQGKIEYSLTYSTDAYSAFDFEKSPEPGSQTA